jgi:hypothetical protein
VSISKTWYLGAAIVGALATMGLAARHELGWVLIGVVSVWCNIYNYTNSEKKEGE